LGGATISSSSSSSTSSLPAASKQRLLFLDNLRIFLTLLVVCHHSAIAFGASGGWYYVIPPPKGSPAPVILTIFASVNQSFFMSLFFAISGYLTPSAYDAKGPARFLQDRLIRLGIPLLVYFFVLNPLVVFLARSFEGRAAPKFAFGTGPLWFVLALLLFDFAYAALRLLTQREREQTGTRRLPSNAKVLGFVLSIGLVAFVVRLWIPVGWEVLGLQLAYFPLYVSLFVFGIWAHGNGWLDSLSRAQARLWLRASLGASVVMFAAFFLFGGAGGADAFRGGATFQSFLYAMWEPVLCVGINMRLLVLFRERFSAQRSLARRMARSAYTAYIIHPFFVVCGTALLARVPVDPLLQFLALCPLAAIPTFALSDVIRRAPGLDRIL
jgi:fucose 4-O-acetylase-like acetyltransferase